MKTREDFTVEKTEGTYGPIWVVSPKVQKGGFYADIHYVLRADWKMDEIPQFRGHKKSVHLDVVQGDDPLKSSHGWKGVYRTDSMDEAVVCLIDDLNRNAGLEEIERAVESAVLQLRNELEDFDHAVENFGHVDIDDVMQNIELAYLALKLKFEEARKKVEL